MESDKHPICWPTDVCYRIRGLREGIDRLEKSYDDMSTIAYILHDVLKKSWSEWKNELVRMKLCNELGGPREQMVRDRIKECQDALELLP